ncbi:ABC transporter permease [Falsibacillus pallidus]|uniref:Transport permease protein n=1 Tax=Falsibacillus pallidus TaxID=493781 RepID=A0A370GU67_9BACI|nr:ABC transporter permease [Falsibacillus pallidus]RDI45483.1 ABC-2 type transport system permease protein [Falsibacillus pallidus]
MNSVWLLIREVKYFTNFNNRMYQFLLFFQPFMFLTIFYFLKQVRGDIQSDKFVVASALISMWSYVLYSSGSSLISQKWSDTLKLLIAAPVSLFKIILSKTISNSVIALISMILSFVYAKFIFHFSIGVEDYSLFFLTVLVLVFSLSVAGLILAIVFVAFQNAFDFQNLILMPMILICGVLIPVDHLPLALRFISYLIPMTWSIKAVHESLLLSPNMYTSLIIAVLVSLVYLAASYFIVKRIENIIRQKGNLGAI